jgi:phosphatidylinositol-3-phosphatase
MLENKSFDHTFAKNSDGPYLRCLAQERGKLLEEYYAIGHWSLDNYIAMVSGQAPNPFTQNDCPYFVDFSELAHVPYGTDRLSVPVACIRWRLKPLPIN